MRSAPKGTLATLALLCALAVPAAAQAASPAWQLQSSASPTNFKSGDESGLDTYLLYITNSGGAPTDAGKITIRDTLSAGLVIAEDEVKHEKEIKLSPPRGNFPLPCSAQEAGGQATVTCEVENSIKPSAEPARLEPGQQLVLEIRVKTPATLSGPLVNQAEVEGGGAAPASWEARNQAGSEDAPVGFQEFRTQLLDADGLPLSAADSHPYSFVTSFEVNTVATEEGAPARFVPAGGDLREVEVALPPGLAANPTVLERCTAKQFITLHAAQPFGNFANECPNGSAVGLVALQQLEGEPTNIVTPVYNLVPPKGMPAQLGFEAVGQPIYLNTKLRSDSDYGVTAYVKNTTEARRVTAGRFTVWGVPGDESHETMRGECAQREPIGEHLTCSPASAAAFMRLPSSCQNPLTTTFDFTTWALPPQQASESSSEAPPVGCATPPFTPEIENEPSTNRADSPSGFHFALALPQEEGEAPEALGEADLHETVVKLPAGLTVNPASADGLAACTPAEVGLTTPPGQQPAHFNLEPVKCPNAAKIGSVEADVPALDHTLTGAAYLAAQEDNPFNSLLAFYIVLEDEQSGIVVKLPAKVLADAQTGQLTTVVQETPPVPFEEFRFDFFEGARAPLRTPMSCGKYTTTTEMTPWSAPEGAKAFPASSFEITGGPQGPCPSGDLAPKLSAGLANTQAGTYSPFSLRLSREDGSGEFAGLTTTPPLGLTARLVGIPYCSEQAIEEAKGREHPGGGQQELDHPSCPSASEVGAVQAGAGAGPSPFYVGGKVYLAGPYKGAPLSFLAVIPAVAGPFDLGTVTNRVAAYVDPETAQVKAVADPLPRILSGIPADARDLRVDFNRPNFTLAPTSCEPKSVSATVTGTDGQSATVSDRFQVGGCDALKFGPKISLRLKGGTRRGDHPSFRAIVTYPQGSAYANTAKASVGLPHSEFLENAHIRTICTRVQFAANACPKGAIYGKARAFTPLLEAPLEGPIYLRSSNNPLPDLVLDLHGQIDAVAVARIDSHNGGIRTSFEAVPDAPLSKVIVEMPAGKKGLLVNSRNICNHTNKATVRFTGQNGKTADSRPVLRDSCKKHKKKHGHKKGKKHHK
jgi:hypothetical protein